MASLFKSKALVGFASIKLFALALGLFITARARAADRTFIICGDSQSKSGSGDWPKKFVALESKASTPRFVNTAADGEFVSDIARYYFDKRIGDYAPSHKGDVVILSILGGTNDLADQRSADFLFDCLRLIWSRSRIAGIKVIAWTIAPRADWTAASSFEAQRLALNALIRSHRSEYDWLMEPGIICPNPADKTIYIDGMHFSQSAGTILAEHLERMISGRINLTEKRLRPDHFRLQTG